MKSEKWQQTYHDKFVKLSKQKFPGRFDYSRTQYKGKYVQITLGCPEHGFFEVQPRSHYRSKTGGCPECNRKSLVRYDREEFVEFAYKFHKGRYTYEEVNYTNSITPVKITCPKHGYFWQMPHEHKRGGCPQCRHDDHRLTQQEFESRANEVHDHMYTYENAVYDGYETNLTISCLKHGDFQQSAHSHLSGRGCPKCKSKAFGWEGMYVYILGSASHPYVKVGITKKTPEVRIRDIRAKSGIEFEPYSNYFFADGGDAKCIEMDMLYWLRENYSNIREEFDGCTEAFICTEYEKVLDKLHELVVKHFDQQMYHSKNSPSHT